MNVKTSKTSKILLSNDWVCAEIAGELAKLGFETVLAPPMPQDAAGFRSPEWQSLLSDVEIIVTSPFTPVTRALMEAAPQLRAVMSAVIGVESIDLDAATELGIIVGHGAMPENFIGMAEATVLFILAQTLDMQMKQRLLRENKPRPRQLQARLLRGQTVGLIGLGRIGRAVVDRLQGWELNLLAYDPLVTAPYRGVTMVDLPTLLASSDIVSLHVTLTEESHHMMNEAAFRAMKPTAHFINTARGQAVDERALYRALKEKWIAGAAIDSFDVEPLPQASPLREFLDDDNVILTPHIIGHTRDVMAAIPRVAAENARRVAQGELPLYTKNPEVEPAWRQRLARLGAG